eukprot:scaffold61146_cov19-Tisochrysis_lutea.AAC.1
MSLLCPCSRVMGVPAHATLLMAPSTCARLHLLALSGPHKLEHRPACLDNLMLGTGVKSAGSAPLHPYELACLNTLMWGIGVRSACSALSSN